MLPRLFYVYQGAYIMFSRFRHVYMTLGSILTILLWLLSDPDAGLIENLPFGASTVATLVILLKSIFYVALLHLSRRALIDYINLSDYFTKALQTSEGAGRALVAVSVMCVAISIVMFAATSS